MRVELPHKNTISADMKDGTRYNADSEGYIEVDRKDHLEQIRNTDLRIRGRQYSFGGGEVTHECGFNQIPALAKGICPKCGEEWQA